MKATALPVGIPLLSAVVVLGWPSRAESCSWTTVKALLAAGAEVNAVKGGSTALDDAVVGRHSEVVKLLIGAGARPGTLTLSFAAGSPPGVVEALLARGAPVRGAPGRGPSSRRRESRTSQASSSPWRPARIPTCPGGAASCR
jgi:hypothetical protein